MLASVWLRADKSYRERTVVVSATQQRQVDTFDRLAHSAPFCYHILSSIY